MKPKATEVSSVAKGLIVQYQGIAMYSSSNAPPVIIMKGTMILQPIIETKALFPSFLPSREDARAKIATTILIATNA